MVSQVLLPSELPFSILDYGLTALALISMVVIVFLFTRFLYRNYQQQQDGVTKSLDAVADELERHTEVSRGMMEEFYRYVGGIRELRDEMAANRRENTKIHQAVQTLVEEDKSWRVEDTKRAEANLAETHAWRTEFHKRFDQFLEGRR